MHTLHSRSRQKCILCRFSYIKLTIIPYLHSTYWQKDSLFTFAQILLFSNILKNRPLQKVFFLYFFFVILKKLFKIASACKAYGHACTTL